MTSHASQIQFVVVDNAADPRRGPIPVLLSWDEEDPLVVFVTFVGAVTVENGRRNPSWIISRQLLVTGGQAGAILVERAHHCITLTLGRPGREVVLRVTEASVDLFLGKTYETADDSVPESWIDAFIASCSAPQGPVDPST